MAYDDADSPFGKDSPKSQRELSPASVSITPVEELKTRDDPVPVTSTPPRRSPRPQPSRIVAKYLFTTEKYVGEWRRHWIHVVAWAVVGLISPFVVGYLVGITGNNNPHLMWIILGVWLLLALVVVYMLVEWWVERFVLTDKRVMLITGFITRRVAMMPLARVTDMAYEQSPLGMVLGYGSFILESAGQDQALREIKPLPKPNELYLRFVQEMYDPGLVDEDAEENSPEGDHAAD